MKPKVIYITGQAYSGSTFFCAMLGSHRDMEPVSELSKWTTHYHKPKRRCACGKRDKECEFWLEIERKWLGGIDSGKINRYVQLQEKFEISRSLWHKNWEKILKESIDYSEFEEMTVSLFDVLTRVSGRSIIIDSSKIPGRAFALAKMDGIEVSIIHLVRNSLRYLQSSLQRERKISLNDSNLLFNTFQLGVQWSTTNLSAEKALEKSGARGLRVRYEDLVSKPLDVLDDIGSALDLNIEDIKTHVMNNLPVSFRHMASGSGYRNRGSKPITNEYAAVENVPAHLKIAFYVGAGVVSRRYGY